MNENYYVSGPFFKKCMPYRVSYDGKKIVITNKDYDIIYTGIPNIPIDIKKFLHDIADPGWDCTTEYCCYMYSCECNPVGNPQNYQKIDMEDYFRRFKTLLQYLGSVDDYTGYGPRTFFVVKNTPYRHLANGYTKIYGPAKLVALAERQEDIIKELEALAKKLIFTDKDVE